MTHTMKYLVLLLSCIGTLVIQPACVPGPFETLTILYTGDALGEIEPCG